MRKLELLAASAIALVFTTPAIAQDATTPVEEVADDGIGDIVITAQRQSQRLQDVPIAVSAFSGEALAAQQIENTSDLQLSLPNVSFTKTNFASASFTIRGIGDLCVGDSCDTATGIHINDMPLLDTRLFETEFFDMERIEVLRGPQGTLYGRNATSGVVNFITAKPNLTKFSASGSFEYGNYESYKVTGMVNVPLGETIGIRLAGYYLNRDGFTRNLYDNSRIDGRDIYSVRGTIRFEPSSSTTLDIMGSYFHEKDDRARIQKQLCARDTTGILGCRPDRVGFDAPNANATFPGVLASRQFLALQSGNNPTIVGMALTNLYGPDIFNTGVTVPTDRRTVNSDFNPTYFAEEIQVMARLEQQLGDQFKLTATGGYTKSSVRSRNDYYISAGNSLANNPGLIAFYQTSLAPGAAFPGGVNPFAQARAAFMPNGPAGPFCVSDVNRNYTGIYGGFVNRCANASTDYDESGTKSRQFSFEAHVDSDLPGPFNFLLGGIYVDHKASLGDYYVASTGIDYISAVLGGATALGQRAAGNTQFPNVFLGPNFYNSESTVYGLKSWGVFGEAYFEASDRLKFTAGIRYSNDKKFYRARTPLLSFPVPFGVTDANQSPFIGTADFDPGLPGNQLFFERGAKFSEFTGRFVADYKLTDNNMIYASYSRGYKSGGINDPVDPIFNVPETFKPELVDAFEIGSKNTFLNNTLQLNLSAFYYRYNDLQLSRIVARTSVNDNTNADIYGFEAEAIIRPDPAILVNLSASYLKTKIKDLALINPRDVSGGRSDVVIIKDLTNASNCAVIPNTPGNAVGSNTLVGAVNSGIGLQAPTPVPGTNTTGAYSVCSALAATIANPPPALRALFQTPTGALPFQVADGVLVDVSGNSLPNAPKYKFSAGFQYAADFQNGMSLIPRVDLTYTGGSYASSFNANIDRMQGYAIVNAQIQLNGADDKWFVRGFVSNLFDNDAITGQYVTDQSTALFTNIFTLEPRRYGVAAGFKF
jgi:outer membrane receptor protein involved in Fe transport